MPYFCEHTDTFGGEANYGWVNRRTIDAPNAKIALRRFRAEVGLTGVRGQITFNSNDEIWWKPYRLCQIVFVQWVEK